jgi:tetratricopeptide (TPR) repeat protein
MSELDDATYDQIRGLCARGDDLTNNGQLSEALKSYWSAWKSLPEPQTAWQAATWILAAIGDVNFQQRNFEAGRDNLQMAMQCPDAVGNPFLHLRLGQCQFELGNMDRAADELARALLIESPRLFQNEDPKYLAFIKGKLKEPPSGW